MKKLTVMMVGVAIILLPAIGFTAVTGSDHDLSFANNLDAAGSITINKCMSCHTPHGADTQGQLWAITAAGSTIGDLCESCHDGTIETVGAAVFTTASKHLHADGTDATDKALCSGTDGSSCHDVHTQNPNTTGKFLVTGSGTCQGCHATGNTVGAPVRVGAGNHDQTNISCTTCHAASTVHSNPTTVAQSGGVETSPGSWLLNVDNRNAYWGGACVACHEGNAPYAGVLPVNGLTTGTYDNNAQLDTERHSTRGDSGDHGIALAMTGCNECHYMHGAGSSQEQGLNAANGDSAYCISCHDGDPGPSVGSNTHPAGATETGYTAQVANFPDGNNVNDDPRTGTNDYGSLGTDNAIICETCHSVHRDPTGAGNPFLRGDNTAANEICTTCHTTN